MAVQLLKERYASQVGTVVLGATKEQGGTRSVSITVGGESALPFQHYEGSIPNRPIIAMEVVDVEPNWPAPLKSVLGDVVKDPALWAKKCVDEWDADVIYVKLEGADPDGANKSPEECAKVVKDILAAVSVPLIVVGCGDVEKDHDVMAKVAEDAAGENLLLGVAEQEDYKSLVAACLGGGHSIIARSPLDINICKQLNILITEMNMPADRIVIDPMIAGLGYGIEYVYSIMERGRMGALQGDKMLAMPMICTVGFESWRAKEAWASEEDFPQWGIQAERGPAWEAMTAAALIQGGADILCMRHPQAVQATKKHIEQLMETK
ncbi:CO dehydrogenase/acetyl-CoA synthase subunit delta [Dehalobacterium formicoaceticum]|uniref:CO dehydrogenase/acetyl-CoA synthase subunit delta n=1 Tax=Dehalobacterium formicoaceticum TaxID=51515 RepID=A0ABT1Y636_9FIRM|nr:CO dehydrogenase/acetyl-CoA synthase subunit delta [Dehalobacterium formicoaceticum]MCR6546349.1 CO dehydrogenase/acetyl-CoA synthase subunit delta [Dehalobacterium formicoaceticum]